MAKRYLIGNTLLEYLIGIAVMFMIKYGRNRAVKERNP